MSGKSVATEKQQLRAGVRQHRDERSAAARHALSSGLTREVDALTDSLEPRLIAAFLPTESEPPLIPALEALAQGDVEVLLPLSRPDRSMDWAPHVAGTPFVVDHLGMPAPAGEIVDSTKLSELDLVLCPAALVDREGFRLGWGLGYYDRFLAGLAHKPLVFAVVFDDEVVASLPRENHDQPVNGVITPTRTIWFH